MIIKKIVNVIINLVGGINDGMKLAGYAKTAQELRLLSDKQLADLGFSRALLEVGVNAYPWREDTDYKIIPDNVTSFEAKEANSQEEIMTQAPKAA